MKTVMIQAPAEDRAFFDNLKEKGEQLEVIKVQRFEGLQEIAQVVVTLTAAVTPILIAYFKEQTELAKGRMVIKDGKKIRMSGYSDEEVKNILSEAASDEDDH